MFKVKLYGAKEYWCQIPRIAEGFKGIGHEVVTGDDYDFVYANNFDYSGVDSEHKDSALCNSGFKIFNVLDIPPHIPDFPIERLKEELSQADIVTCISDPVKEQLREIGVSAPVIWNPIKDVFFDSSMKREINCLYVGRCSDPNKRFDLLQNIEKYVVGPTGGSTSGNYLGLVNDVSLNQLYNSAKIVALPSKFEGLGLPALEAMAAGAVPLVCKDNPNSSLCPDFCVAEPTVESVTSTYNSLINHFTHYQSVIVDEWTPWVQQKFSKFSIAENIVELFENYNS
jgi:glycosyltransferase involved in cell wall biosynthesis|tara:strand:- start:330 stop:1181 length:852 start_codon:yes stop_codon:yes gene_type:complete